ncbi:MAG: hypothetical protein QXM46_03595 [Candidatus Hadarchaeales archaeon]
MKLSLKWGPKGPNWFGLVAGPLMILLPFLGAWWSLTLGTGAVDFSLSPFSFRLVALDQPISSTLVRFICLGATLTLVISGIFLILASLYPKRWWSRRLLKFGATKLLWMWVGFLVLLLALSLLGNFLAGKVPELRGFSLPYLSGSSTAVLEMENTTITLPLRMSLGWPFFFALVPAVLGVLARIYHRRFSSPEE